MGFDWPSNGAGWRHDSWGPVEFWHATARSRDELSSANRKVVCIELASFPNTNGAQPNGSRLSCGRNVHRRKIAERKGKRRGEATEVFPTSERPAASSAC